MPSRDDADPSDIKDVSSAYCDILYSSLSTSILLIYLLFWIEIPKISVQRINKHGDTGSPCLQPLLGLKYLESIPF